MYVELPPKLGAPEGSCGLLKRHMYGTRQTAEGWQDEYSSYLRKLGFVQGEASACVFRHPERRILVSVHGDDFTSSTGSNTNSAHGTSLLWAVDSGPVRTTPRKPPSLTGWCGGPKPESNMKLIPAKQNA